MGSTQLLVAAVVAVAMLGVAWFAVRFWLASTRPVDIKDIQTPALDRLNRKALERDADGDDEREDMFGFEDDDEDETDDAAPEGLRDVVKEEGRP